MTIGVFLGGRSTQQIVDRAKLAESLGYESGWIIQIADREATIVAASVATGTTSLKIGTGVLPAYPRTPVVMAQTAATLDEISNGRFILGLGTSHKVTIEMWHGMELSRPLRTIREYVEAIRAVFESRPYSGEIYRTAFSFSGFRPSRTPPIYLSCLSPKMTRLTGEIADGAVLWMCSPRYIASNISKNLAAGRERAGKEESTEVVAAVPVSLTENRNAGREAFRKVATVYWSLPFYRAAIIGGGHADAVEDFDRGGPAAIPDDVIDEFCGIGDVETCRAAVDRYRSAGVTVPAVSVLPQHDGSADWEETVSALAKS